MSVIGVAVIPLGPGGATSPSASIVSHLSHKYPAEAHRDFHVDHRLFINTSSMLSGAELKQRQYLQMLTTSRSPQHTYITASVPSAPEPATITIPAASQDALALLITSKLQPQWAHRQSLHLTGIEVDLPFSGEDKWTIRFGDLRIAGSGQRQGAANLAGNTRGVLVELQYLLPDATQSNLYDFKDLNGYHPLFREALRNAVVGHAEYNLDEVKFLLRKIPDDKLDTDSEGATAQQSETALHAAELYMELLRGARG